MIDWFNVADYKERFRPNTFFIGGRRIGKTFSAFSLIYGQQPFIYARNTEKELDECCCTISNPFKKWNNVTGHDLRLRKEKSHALIIEDQGDNEHVVGMGLSVSLLGAMRGIDLSDYKKGVYDEFIEKRKLNFDQGKYYDDLYETINSNRELEGEDPFVFILLSNAQKLDNSILVRKNLVTPIEQMMANGQQTWSNKSCFVCLPESNVSELKKQSAFYQGMEGSATYEEALNNRFANDSFYGIVRSRPLKEYIGVCQIDDIYIYKHKSNGKFYACNVQCLNLPRFSSRDNFSIFYRSYGKNLDVCAALGMLEYSNFMVKSRLMDILKL